MKKTGPKQQKVSPRTKNEEDEITVLAKIAATPEQYRTMGERIHALIKNSAPDISPRLWYGMPTYSKDCKVICFFRGDKNERYMTLGF